MVDSLFTSATITVKYNIQYYFLWHIKRKKIENVVSMTRMTVWVRLMVFDATFKTEENRVTQYTEKTAHLTQVIDKLYSMILLYI
jgi:hypothetical protein